ncbi:unnamed protein product [Blepharisma stoltei]|uniref:Uncharacterized protein n=1 Tax=Blepharisma stoltei TaxID=1481888 RepID=A0AAU9IVI2_9CILI|nr:unnamed protein product [Blepharisma stoltei]
MYFILLVAIALGKNLKESSWLKSQINPGETKLYTVSKNDLYPDSAYEIRVSYLGTIGANFLLKWDCDSQSNLRRLLDIEKIVFRTDSNRNIIGLSCSEYKLRVKAYRNSRGSDVNADTQIIQYEIIMERVESFTLIPMSTFPMIIVTLFMIGTAIYISRLLTK